MESKRDLFQHHGICFVICWHGNEEYISGVVNDQENSKVTGQPQVKEMTLNNYYLCWVCQEQQVLRDPSSVLDLRYSRNTWESGVPVNANTVIME